MSKTQVLALLGLAMRAGKLLWGTESVLKRFINAKLIILASDCSALTADKFSKKGFHYNIKILQTFSSAEISRALGKSNIKVVAVCDQGFSEKIMEIVTQQERGAKNEG